MPKVVISLNTLLLWIVCSVRLAPYKICSRGPACIQAVFELWHGHAGGIVETMNLSKVTAKVLFAFNFRGPHKPRGSFNASANGTTPVSIHGGPRNVLMAFKQMSPEFVSAWESQSSTPAAIGNDYGTAVHDIGCVLFPSFGPNSLSAKGGRVRSRIPLVSLELLAYPNKLWWLSGEHPVCLSHPQEGSIRPRRCDQCLAR